MTAERNWSERSLAGRRCQLKDGFTRHGKRYSETDPIPLADDHRRRFVKNRRKAGFLEQDSYNLSCAFQLKRRGVFSLDRGQIIRHGITFGEPEKRGQAFCHLVKISGAPGGI